MKKITITEENYMTILDRIQKITNKYKMFQFHQVFTEDMKEKKQYRNCSVGFRRELTRTGKDSYRRLLKFFCNSNFIDVTKHRFRIEFETNPGTYNAKLYVKMKSLIHLDIGSYSVVVLSEGDKIRFLPFNLGFVTYTDNDYTRFSNPLIISRETFILNISDKIKNLQEEKSIRESEWEDADREHEQIWLKEELEFEQRYYNNDDDFSQLSDGIFEDE